MQQSNPHARRLQITAFFRAIYTSSLQAFHSSLLADDTLANYTRQHIRVYHTTTIVQNIENTTPHTVLIVTVYTSSMSRYRSVDVYHTLLVRLHMIDVNSTNSMIDTPYVSRDGASLHCLRE